MFVYIPSASLATTKLTNQDQDIYQMMHGGHVALIMDYKVPPPWATPSGSRT